MNQIISQHGWGLDSSIWKNINKQFISNSWYWRDNERGYFSKESKSCKWDRDLSNKHLRIAICHSLGTYLIDPTSLLKATHVVLINSFNNFIPTNNKRNLILKKLQIMEQKIPTSEVANMIEEFTYRSFLPNSLDLNCQKQLKENIRNINTQILLEDFKKLFIVKNNLELFDKVSKLLIIKSKKDYILDKDSSYEFINLLNKTQLNKPKVIEIENEGHILTKINFYEIVKKWISNG